MADVFDAFYERASSFFIMGEYDAAHGPIMEALGIRPDDCDALRLAAVIMAGLDDLEAALRYIDRAISIKPNDADLHDTKASVLISANSFADAEEEARIALDLAKGQGCVPLIDGLDFIYLRLVEALAQQGKVEEAQRTLHEGSAMTKSELLQSVGQKILD